MIQVERLVKNFGMHPVLRGVDLHVARGEFLTLLGPNGAGKTTLLRIVATLSQPTSGEVRVGGWRLPDAAPRVRPHLGLISHQTLLYGELTAAENLRFFARLYGLPEPEPRIHDVLGAVGLSGRQDDLVDSFSRGMQQRLAIARAILHEPEVLLLDEPYTGLDQSAAIMLDELLRSVATTGRTVMMTTHDIARGLANSDQVAILSHGRIAFCEPSERFEPGDFVRVYDQVVRGLWPS
jgi:heme exporter protein A